MTDSPTSRWSRSRLLLVQPQLFVDRRFQLQKRGRIVKARAVEEKNVFGPFAQGVDLGAGDVHVGSRQGIRDARKQPRPVPGDDLQDEMRSLVVGKDADLRRQRKMFEVATDAARRGRLQG